MKTRLVRISLQGYTGTGKSCVLLHAGMSGGDRPLHPAGAKRMLKCAYPDQMAGNPEKTQTVRFFGIAAIQPALVHLVVR